MTAALKAVAKLSEGTVELPRTCHFDRASLFAASPPPPGELCERIAARVLGKIAKAGCPTAPKSNIARVKPGQLSSVMQEKYVHRAMTRCCSEAIVPISYND